MNYQRPPFEAVKFIPPNEKESTLNRTVLLLYAVGGH